MGFKHFTPSPLLLRKSLENVRQQNEEVKQEGIKQGIQKTREEKTGKRNPQENAEKLSHKEREKKTKRILPSAILD